MFNELEIINGCKKYQKSAQMELYKKFAPLMRGVCMRYASRETDVADILQEGFLKVFNKINDYKGLGSFEGWIRRVIINNAINDYKKNKKYLNHLDIDENKIAESIIDETESIEIESGNIKLNDLNAEMIENLGFTHSELLEILNRVPEPFKFVFNLHCIEHFKHEEIATMLNIDVKTSRTRLLRARKIIRQMLYTMCTEKINEQNILFK